MHAPFTDQQTEAAVYMCTASSSLSLVSAGAILHPLALEMRQ